MNKTYINKVFQMIAGGVAAALLAAPAFGQQKMPLTNCADATKILPAAKARCEADMVIRKECNTKSNPGECYRAKTAAASTSTTTATTKPASTPVTTQPAAKPATAQPAAQPKPATTPPAATTSSSAGLATAVPAGAKSCATDGKTCNVTGNWTGVYGANGKFAQIKGSGAFVCLPKNLGIADPAPGVGKTCYLTSGTMASTATAKPVAQAKVRQLPLSCSGGAISATRKIASTGDLGKHFNQIENVNAASPTAATDTCRASCAKTGEPAPCGWYTLVQWRIDTSADGKSRTQYTCYKANARSAKDAFKPVMEKDKNYGTPSNGAFYRDAWTYPCTR